MTADTTEHRSEIGAPTASLIILTTGDRPGPLRAAIESAAAQEGVSWAQWIVVANGASIDAIDCVEMLALPTNVGIPEGRNVGAAAASGDVLVFLDDDAEFGTTDVVSRAIERFRDQPNLGAVACRIADEHGSTASRHVPRIGGRHPMRSGRVTSFLGGASMVRRVAFDEAGGYAGDFFYALEETDLALGLIDMGWTLRYEPDCTVLHPRTNPARHDDYIWRTARNRVLLVRRRLPWAVGVLYVMNWFVLTALRQRLRPGALRASISGTRAGWTHPKPDRRRISWSTVWQLTRLGRPPII